MLTWFKSWPHLFPLRVESLLINECPKPLCSSGDCLSPVAAHRRYKQGHTPTLDFRHRASVFSKARSVLPRCCQVLLFSRVCVAVFLISVVTNFLAFLLIVVVVVVVFWGGLFLGGLFCFVLFLFFVGVFSWFGLSVFLLQFDFDLVLPFYFSFGLFISRETINDAYFSFLCKCGLPYHGVLPAGSLCLSEPLPPHPIPTPLTPTPNSRWFFWEGIIML